jgi:hypothetical protein
MDNDKAVATFFELKESQAVSEPADLDDLWSGLEPIPREFMIGAWSGGELPSGHKMDGQLELARWHGKTFHSIYDVKPLVCRDANGTLYSNQELGKGEASLWNVDFRGETTASMVYDGQPVIDHFKKVDDSHVMGIMNGKTSLVRERHFYFYLERE